MDQVDQAKQTKRTKEIENTSLCMQMTEKLIKCNEITHLLKVSKEAQANIIHCIYC